MLKVLIVGYGSMGRRRIRLASEIVPAAEFMCVDLNEERLKQAEAAGIKGYISLDEGIAQHPDMAFVCTSPGHHAEIILKLISSGIHIFTELNLLSDKYDEIIRTADNNNIIVFLSSTLLYKRQMEIIDSIVKKQVKPLTYIYHVGQYLPDWHPWESYKDFFVGKKETNGVREIFAIQLPWLIETFGEVDSVESIRQRSTELDIEYPDIITTTITHTRGHAGVFVSDVVSRKAVTRLEVIGEDLHLFWDGHKDDLYQLNIKTGEMEQIHVYDSDEHVDGYSDNIAEQAYREEIKSFLSVVKGEGTPRYSLAKDKEVLALIDQIEGRS